MPAIAAEPHPFPFNPAACALLVIDMQRDFLEPGGFGAALGNDVSLYTVASGGALVPEWPATIATGLDPAYITFDPAGAFAYVVSQGWNEVYSYAVSATSGRLVPMNPAWVSTGTGPACIALSSTWASP